MDGRGHGDGRSLVDLRAELERACADLVYSSESDRPFEFFSVALPRTESLEASERFRLALGLDVATPVETRSLSRFFARHTDTSDPYDVRSQQIRPRYEALIALLEARLKGVQVYRTGKITVDCFILGDDGTGRLSGLRTVAIET